MRATVSKRFSKQAKSETVGQREPATKNRKEKLKLQYLTAKRAKTIHLPTATKRQQRLLASVNPTK